MFWCCLDLAVAWSCHLLGIIPGKLIRSVMERTNPNSYLEKGTMYSDTKPAMTISRLAITRVSN